MPVDTKTIITAAIVLCVIGILLTSVSLGAPAKSRSRGKENTKLPPKRVPPKVPLKSWKIPSRKQPMMQFGVETYVPPKFKFAPPAIRKVIRNNASLPEPIVIPFEDPNTIIPGRPELYRKKPKK
jgi:hypothetical protein